MNNLTLFDTHAHYDDPAFDADRFALLDSLFGSGAVCGIVNAGTNPITSGSSAVLAERFAGVWFAAGVHPSEITGESSDLDAVRALLDHPKCVAVGEIGLDYHYDDGPPRETQLKWLDAQLSLAEQTGKPAIIHDRDAHGDILDLLRAHKCVRCVLHSYSGSAEMLRELTRAGRYISFSGVVTFKNASKILDCVRAVPDELILIETDCPYLAPHPNRGRRNDSGMLQLTAAAAAALCSSDYEDFAALTVKNAKDFFGIK